MLSSQEQSASVLHVQTVSVTPPALTSPTAHSTNRPSRQPGRWRGLPSYRTAYRAFFSPSRSSVSPSITQSSSPWQLAALASLPVVPSVEAGAFLSTSVDRNNRIITGATPALAIARAPPAVRLRFWTVSTPSQRTLRSSGNAFRAETTAFGTPPLYLQARVITISGNVPQKLGNYFHSTRTTAMVRLKDISIPHILCVRPLTPKVIVERISSAPKDKRTDGGEWALKCHALCSPV